MGLKSQRRAGGAGRGKEQRASAGDNLWRVAVFEGVGIRGLVAGIGQGLTEAEYLNTEVKVSEMMSEKRCTRKNKQCTHDVTLFEIDFQRRRL